MKGQDLSFELLQMLSQNPDIQTFMDETSELMGNPLMVIDARFRILYAASNVKLDIPLWTDSISEHYVSDQIINHMEENDILQQIRQKNDYFYLDLPNGYHAIRVPLFYKGTNCGFIGAYDYLRPFEEEDGLRLELIARALTVIYNADPNILGRMNETRNDFFLELLKCESEDMAQIICRRNASLSFGPRKYIICLTRRKNGMSAENVAFGRLQTFLEHSLYNHASAIYNNRLLLLFSLDKLSRNLQNSILQDIQNCCRQYNLNAGISFSFEEDSFIPKAYKQSLKAALYGDCRDSSKDRISYYDDYMLQDIMNATLRVNSPSFYEHPFLRKVAAYDREFGTNVAQVIQTGSAVLFRNTTPKKSKFTAHLYFLYRECVRLIQFCNDSGYLIICKSLRQFLYLKLLFC